MDLLIVNPNSTASMTRTIEAAAKAVSAPGTRIVAATSQAGPASIEGYYDEALSVPGLLAEIRDGERGGARAAVIACFDDTGLDAARAMARIPVLGICEAALSLAAFVARRFTVVTTAEAARVPVEDLVARYGMAGRARVRAAGMSVLSLEDPASGSGELLRGEIRAALTQDHAEAIVLGCAGMADLARRLSEEFGVPVIDGVSAAVKQAEALAALGLFTSKRGAYAAPSPKRYSGAMASFAPMLSGTE